MLADFEALDPSNAEFYAPARPTFLHTFRAFSTRSAVSICAMAGFLALTVGYARAVARSWAWHVCATASPLRSCSRMGGTLGSMSPPVIGARVLATWRCGLRSQRPSASSLIASFWSPEKPMLHLVQSSSARAVSSSQSGTRSFGKSSSAATGSKCLRMANPSLHTDALRLAAPACARR